MEFDKNYGEKEDLTYPSLLQPNNYLKSEITEQEEEDDDFYLQDFDHHLDQFSFTGSSLTPEFDLENPCFDPFDPFQNIGPLSIDDFYELKPFSHHQNEGNGTTDDGMQYPRKTLVDVSEPDPSSMPFICEDVKPMNFVIPDEGSCITAENIGYHKGNNGTRKNGAPQSRRPCSNKGRKKSNSVKGQWTIEEDRLLVHLVEKHGIRKWSQIAQMLKGRIGKQCRERWHNHLRPDIKKDIWSEEEDRILIHAHAEIGNKWAEIAKRLTGRTENSIKNHWNATKRRQYSRRKCRTKYPRPSSLLQNYIKSLNLDGKSDTTAAATIPPPLSSLHKAPLPALPLPVLPPPIHQPETFMEFCVSDRLVPDYDFGDVAEFAFSDKLFEGSSIDSLLDQLPPIGDDHIAGKSCFDMGMGMPLDMASFMQSHEVKKEMDLVEMITQVNL
ncbi:transcription factor MYB98-like [Rhododendron vialii]|uniref:transcription factor MYB98-like n=1 Tax=Rhododendron vialii TaxID=182163 RepID=UPI00265D9CD6|nr:transcription factor MYB98-like [Rhododendron vialii]